MNPWLEIPLEDYEAHMSMASVGQAQYLAATLAGLVHEHRPRSVAIIGCSGGNGLDELPAELVERVVGVDINPEYIAAVHRRYRNRFSRLDLVCDDFLSPTCVFPPVDFVFAGLLLEYVDYTAGLSALQRFVSPTGHLSVVLQLSSATLGAVSPTPYKSIKKLDGALKLVPPENLRAHAMASGFAVLRARRTVLPSGKAFFEFLFRIDRAPGPPVR